MKGSVTAVANHEFVLALVAFAFLANLALVAVPLEAVHHRSYEARAAARAVDGDLARIASHQIRNVAIKFLIYFNQKLPLLARLSLAESVVRCQRTRSGLL